MTTKLLSAAFILCTCIECNRAPKECAIIPEKVMAGRAFQMLNCSKRADDHKWQIQHLEVLTTENPTYQFEGFGEYKITHTVNNDNGSDYKTYMVKSQAIFTQSVKIVASTPIFLRKKQRNTF